MSDKKGGGPAAIIRPVLLLALVAGGFLWWRAAHKPEGYTGGDVRTTGTIEADHVRLGFRTTGRIQGVTVQEGQKVNRGDLVARLESQDQDVQVRSARATLESARALVAQAEAAHAKARQDLARTRSLMQSDATTQQLLDGAEAAESMTAAQLSAARAQVHQAESALAQAQLQLSYTVVRSPQAGQVTERVHLPGEMVNAGVAVVAISQLDTVKVRAAVDETRVGAVRPGDSVEVRVYSFDKKVFQGNVTDVSPAGDFATRKDWGAQRRDIRTFSVTARVPNPEGLLKDGMTADVVIKTSTAAKGAAGVKP